MSIEVNGQWADGYGATFVLNNTTSQNYTQWKLQVPLSGSTTIDWVDLNKEADGKGGVYLTPKPWTPPLAASQSVKIPFGGRGLAPTQVYFSTDSGPPPPPPPPPPDPDPDPSPSSVHASIEVQNQWSTGYGAAFVLNNTGTQTYSQWKLQVPLSGSTTIEWVDLNKESDGKGGVYLTPKPWTPPLAATSITKIQFGGNGLPPTQVFFSTDTIPPDPDPDPDPDPTPTPSPVPARYFAPYVDILLWPTFSVTAAQTRTGQKWYTLAFIVADTNRKPSWGGVVPLSDNFYASEIASLRSQGGDVIVSFGGASGQELATVITSVTDLVAAYQSVITQYSLRAADFDIEGAAVEDSASIARRNAALKILGDNNPQLRMSYCLPVLPSGLTPAGVALLENAVAHNVRVDSVRIMAMDYGGNWSNSTTMGEYAIMASNATLAQMAEAGLTCGLGVCPMIGLNDVAGEVFTQTDARALLSYANSTAKVTTLSMWSSTRDKDDGSRYVSPTASGIPQQPDEFTIIFGAFP